MLVNLEDTQQLVVLSVHHVFLKGLFDVNTQKATCFVAAYKIEDIKACVIIGVAYIYI